jgi:hypothetical protein
LGFRRIEERFTSLLNIGTATSGIFSRQTSSAARGGYPGSTRSARSAMVRRGSRQSRKWS